MFINIGTRDVVWFMSQLLLPSMIEVKSRHKWAIEQNLKILFYQFVKLERRNARVAIDILYRPSVEQCLELGMAQVLRSTGRGGATNLDIEEPPISSPSRRLESDSDEKVDFEGDTGEVVKGELSGVAGCCMKL